MKDLAQLKSPHSFKHHFLPHKEHKKRARLLHHKFFYFYASLFLFFILILNVSKTFLPGVLGYDSEIKISELLEKTNKIREESGLPKLILNERLSKAALEKANYMFKYNFWAHTAPDGTEPWDFILKNNYDYAYAGENLARNFYYSSEVVQAWFKSPSHKENLLSVNYDEVGFAVVSGILDGYETTLVVQMFGRPKDLSMIATTEQQNLYLSSLKEASKVSTNPNVEGSSVIDVSTIFRYLAFSILGFVLALFLLDGFYSKKHGIDKFTGHTSAHLIMLLATIVSLFVIFKNGHVI
jgi:hypothetical protein